MPTKPTNKLLLVEGKDDGYVLTHLSKHYQIDVERDFKIKNKGGVDNISKDLVETLEVELLASGLECLGIIVDADTDIAARWQSLRNNLIISGYVVPEKPEKEGTIIKHDELPIVGIWVMPDNTLPGFLEDFVSFLVPTQDTLWSRAIACIDRIPPEERNFTEGNLTKAQIHTWLAWQKDPGTPLGLAITKKYLDAKAPQARQLVQWLRRLFSL